jgi:NADH-quinone oxidoreductase subunit B
MKFNLAKIKQQCKKEGMLYYLLNKLCAWSFSYNFKPYIIGHACCKRLLCDNLPEAKFEAVNIKDADVLFICGNINHKKAQYIKDIYDSMCQPKWAVLIGNCSNNRGLYSKAYDTNINIDQIIPIDMKINCCYIGGNENIADSLRELRNLIREHKFYSKKRVIADE